MNKYICLTLGPIVESLIRARKTREIWAASFLFSWIMKSIVDKLNIENVVIPYNKSGENDELKDVGLYPDHLVYKCAPGDELNILNVIREVKQTLIKQIAAGNNDKVAEFVNNYFQFSYFTIELDHTELHRQGKNFMQRIDEIFYSLELRRSIKQETEYSLADFFNSIPLKNEWYRNHFGEERCPSLIEIATCKSMGTDEQDDEAFLERVKQSLGDRFKSYHKYVAIIQCDGDKMGRFNQGYIDQYMKENLDGSPDEVIRRVSDCLFRWGRAAAKLIKDFGGLPVYAGGDDLLFFAPVVNKEKKIIIELLDEISEVFRKEMSGLSGGNPEILLPTLSFGAAITYYKYPLGEAQQMALELMYDMKRKYGGNGINVTVLKHSGSDFTFPIHFNALKHNERYCRESVFRNLMNLSEDNMNEEIISATAYYLQKNRKLFECIGNDPLRIRQFFVHNMQGFPKEETITSDGKYKEGEDEKIHFLLEVEKLVKLAYVGQPVKDVSGERMDRMLLVTDMLRTVKFFKGLDEIH